MRRAIRLVLASQERLQPRPQRYGHTSFYNTFDKLDKLASKPITIDNYCFSAFILARNHSAFPDRGAKQITRLLPFLFPT